MMRKPVRIALVLAMTVGLFLSFPSARYAMAGICTDAGNKPNAKGPCVGAHKWDYVGGGSNLCGGICETQTRTWAGGECSGTSGASSNDCISCNAVPQSIQVPYTQTQCSTAMMIVCIAAFGIVGTVTIGLGVACCIGATPLGCLACFGLGVVAIGAEECLMLKCIFTCTAGAPISAGSTPECG